jgi:1,4-dihydroxy-2-naphthoyl-CoA hydrolase
VTPGPLEGWAPHSVRGPSAFPGLEFHAPRSPCRQICVTTDIPAGLSAGFDTEIGLTYLELTPDGGTAQLQIHDKLLQIAGIVHGGVYCSIIESVASVSGGVWLAENGGGSVVGVNNNTDFLRAISSGTVTAVSTPIHRGRRQQLWLVTITDDKERVVARGQVRLQNLPAEQ